MSRVIRPFAALLALAFALSCRSAPTPAPAPVAVSPAEAPLLLESLTVTGQSLEGVSLLLAGRVGAEMKARELTWKASIDGREAGGGTAALTGAGPFSVPVTASYGASAADLAAFEGSPTAHVTVEASIVEGGETLTLSRGLEIVSPRPLEARIVTVQANKPHKDVIEMTFLLEIRNPNAFEVPVGTVHYGVTLGGRPVMESDLPPASAKVPGSSESQFELPVAASAQNVGKEIGRLWKQSELDWGFQGTLQSGALAWPFKLSGSLKVSK